jgi:hypothetical protein
MLLPQFRVSEQENNLNLILTPPSSISSSFKKVEAMPSTPYVDKCSRFLEEANEFSTDRILAYLVRLQYSVQKVAQNLPSETHEAHWDLNTPVMMLVEALAAQLRATRLSLPQEFQQDGKLLPYLSDLTLTHVAISRPASSLS